MKGKVNLASARAQGRLEECDRKLTELSETPSRAKLAAITRKTALAIIRDAVKDAREIAGERLAGGHQAASATSRTAACQTIRAGVQTLPAGRSSMPPAEWRRKAAKVLSAAGHAAHNAYRPTLNACTSTLDEFRDDDQGRRYAISNHVGGTLAVATNHDAIMLHLP